MLYQIVGCSVGCFERRDGDGRNREADDRLDRKPTPRRRPDWVLRIFHGRARRIGSDVRTASPDVWMLKAPLTKPDSQPSANQPSAKTTGNLGIIVADQSAI